MQTGLLIFMLLAVMVAVCLPYFNPGDVSFVIQFVALVAIFGFLGIPIIVAFAYGGWRRERRNRMSTV